MRIIARSTGRAMPLTPALREHIARRLQFALAPVHGRLPRVQVWVGDENGPRGGSDKFCSIRADIEGQEPVFVRDRHEDLYAAIALAAARIGRTAARALRRSKLAGRRRGGEPDAELEA